MGGKIKSRIVREHQVYTTPFLPGFELPLAKLLGVSLLYSLLLAAAFIIVALGAILSG